MSEQNPPTNPGGSSRPPVPGGEPPFWAAPGESGQTPATPGQTADAAGGEPASAGPAASGAAPTDPASTPTPPLPGSAYPPYGQPGTPTSRPSGNIPPYGQPGIPTPPPGVGMPPYGQPGGGFPPAPGAGYPPYGQPGWPGQPGPGGGPRRPSPVAAPPGTDFPGKTLGIVGLILAIVANLVGIIVSAVALSRSRRAGFRNTPALAGVITGSVLLAVGIIVALTFAVIGVASGLASAISAPYSSGDDDPGSVPWATATPDPLATPTDPSYDIFQYQVGDCFDDQPDDATSVTVIDCSTPHDWEVYFNFTVPDTADGSYPGDDKMQQAADQACYDAFADFVGVSYEDSDYDYGYVTPSKSTWIANDDRVVSCAVYDPAGKLTGSLRGAGQ
ncbi:MAG: hypothetical protein EPO52_10855 [Herbiconiux sp.]|uniref:DUF4190 domain-containing protein n=1 Tax=Herbiconiux sp. TaxID=1871186 RepID=UPI00122B8ABD|nr:septum formation family protein [Herbiconiux sp.]TAJ48605.1 MAG: hypothetical protein EPO52_10855 [Herbiconiux sp.]